MTDDQEAELAQARRVGDTQWAQAAELFDDLVGAARGELGRHSPTDVWVVLSTATAAKLQCTTPRQQLAVKMAVTAALREAQRTEPPDEG